MQQHPGSGATRFTDERRPDHLELPTGLTHAMFFRKEARQRNEHLQRHLRACSGPRSNFMQTVTRAASAAKQWQQLRFELMNGVLDRKMQDAGGGSHQECPAPSSECNTLASASASTGRGSTTRAPARKPHCRSVVRPEPVSNTSGQE